MHSIKVLKSKSVIITNLLLGFLFIWFSEFAHANDYFTAHEKPDVQQYLRLVNRAHTDKILPLLGADRINDAKRELRYVLERFPNHPKGLMLVKVIARSTRNPGFGLIYFQRALKLYPQYAITRAQYGSYLVHFGHINEGITELKQSVEMDPELVAGHLWLAKAYMKVGRLELARESAAQARELGYTRQIPGDN